MSAVRPRIAYGAGPERVEGPIAGRAGNPLTTAGVTSIMKWIGTAAEAET